jgi:hypothetical protein
MLLHNIYLLCAPFENTKEKFKIYLENALNYWKRKKKRIFTSLGFWPSSAAAHQHASACLPSARPVSSSRARSFLG